jgi:hypothetical protein
MSSEAPEKVAHSPLPWRTAEAPPLVKDGRCVMAGRYYVATCHECPGDPDDDGNDIYGPVANAELIVRAVNAHEELVGILTTARQAFEEIDRVLVSAQELGATRFDLSDMRKALRQFTPPLDAVLAKVNQ